MEYFTSTTGDDELNDGQALERAFATVTRGVQALTPGDRLRICAGTYAERVHVGDKGSNDPEHPSDPILIEPFDDDDDVVVIDGAVNTLPGRNRNVFREPGNEDWSREGETDEWVSRDPLPAGTAFGAFIEEPDLASHHVRLNTHHNPHDLRADNQKFGPMPEELEVGDPPGVHEMNPRYDGLPRRPWVYLGPGIWQDDADHIRVRLTHTTHSDRRIRNYAGPTDPRQLALAICTELQPTLRIVNSGSIEVRGITIRGGGWFAVAVEGSLGTVLDHLTILAGPDAIHIHGHAQATTITNCHVDGGIPPWMFRSDLKDEYRIRETDKQNLLGRQTSETLLACALDSEDLLIANCEFVNGHDLQIAGTNVEFHHNYVTNVNDDFAYVGATAVNLCLHHNVVERVRRFLSLMEDSESGPSGSIATSWTYGGKCSGAAPTRGQRSSRSLTLTTSRLAKTGSTGSTYPFPGMASLSRRTGRRPTPRSTSSRTQSWSPTRPGRRPTHTSSWTAGRPDGGSSTTSS